MDGNNWRPNQGEPTMDGADWRSQLIPETRHRIVNKIMDTLKKHLPISGPEGLVELRKIAIRFEEKIYTGATSQSDYLRKISLKMLTMEKPNVANSLQPKPGGDQNPPPPDPASQSLQSQVRNPGQSLSIPMGNQPQQRQQILNQNLQNSIASGAVQSSPSMQPGMPSVTGLTQTAMSNVVGQSSNLQTMPGISQNSVNNSVGQVQSTMFSNSQRQIQGRQLPQQVLSQQHQQQSQNPQQFYQQQFQQQMMKQKLQPGNMQSSLLQSHMQQQQQQSSLLQPNQMQPSQQSLLQISSGLQSSQATLQQTQPSMMQSVPQSGLQQNHLQQNQQCSVPQSGPSGLQQHPQSVLRQQQQPQQPSVHQQTSVLHQQQGPISQQSMLQSQQQQQLMGQQPSATGMQQNQLIGQQNNVSDMQQQQQQQQMLLNQQNNLSNMQQQQQQLIGQQNKNLHQQQQLGPQSNVSGLQQQQQLIGSQPGSGVSSMQQHQHSMHMLQHPKVAAQQQQQQNQQTSSTMLPSQGQSQSQPPQQQLMPQLQPSQLQQQLGVQQQPNTIQREMQQRIQTSGALLQPHNAMEQKQLFQSQRALPEASSTSMDSTAQTGHAGVVDWQEEVYQKIKSMKDLYLPELNELYQKIAMRCQQQDALIQQPKLSEQIDRLKFFKGMLERMITFLQVPKSSISPSYKEKLSQYEKQIIGVLNSNRLKKPALSQQPGQQQLQQSVVQSHLMPHQPQSQMTQIQQHDNLVNSMQPAAVTNLQHGSMPLSTHLGVPASQQNMMNALQTGSSLDSAPGPTLSSLSQGAVGSMQQGAVGSLQQNTINTPQQTNISTMSQNSMNQLQSNINSLQANSNMIQQQHLKQQQQEQQLIQSQQLKQQYQQRHILQLMQQQQKQQMMQQQQQQQQQQPQQQQQQQFQQQQLQQQKLQQSSQLQPQQMSQPHQITEVNELKVRPGTGVKPGLFPQSHPAGQRSTTYHQQLKPGTSFPISSPQLLQAASPQISQHSSPQIDHQNLLSTLPKAGTPLQSANSPFLGTSPSTPVAPSPIPGDSEKQTSAVSSISNAGNIGHQQTAHGLTQAQSLAIGTPGISASPLLAEFTSLDGNQGSVPATISGKSSATERPQEQLIKLVRLMSPKAFSSSVSDIGSVVSMIDRIAGSAPGNGSRAAVGEDMVAMTKCRLQARNFMSNDGNTATKKMRRHTSAMPLNAVSSAGSINDSLKQVNSLETSELESTATSRVKWQKAEANHTLLEEIREINQRLIDTVVEISEEDGDSIAAAAEGEGTVVKCSYNAVALSPNMKSQYASAQMSPILPLRLLVPANYPNCSPIVLDKLLEPSKEFQDMSVKAKQTFSKSLRGLSQPISLVEMARTWDFCARKVIGEYAQQSGGGSFSSRFGTWENCVSV